MLLAGHPHVSQTAPNDAPPESVASELLAGPPRSHTQAQSDGLVVGRNFSRAVWSFDPSQGRCDCTRQPSQPRRTFTYRLNPSFPVVPNSLHQLSNNNHKSGMTSCGFQHHSRVDPCTSHLQCARASRLPTRSLPRNE